MKKIFAICMLCFAVNCTVLAQALEQQDNIYEEALADYDIGRFDDAISLLEKNMKLFQGDYKQSAYRLLSLCHLALDDNEGAERYAALLLRENPYYSTTLQDPLRFVDIVNNMKSGMTATITTASSQAEGIEESPVPITLITEEMISACGGRNLKEVLLAYVPGMTDIDNNGDINVAMRGVFSSGQEKILIMLNGHRLNSYATNTGSPDFSMSLEKIKQIEVLRGPSSSLYGGVALTAVINIITKSGRDVDGARLKVGAGNYGQLRGDILFGKTYYDVDIMAWGSIYRASGQTAYADSTETGTKAFGNYTLGAFKGGPSYDLGMTVRWKQFSFLYNSRNSKVIPPLSAGYSFAPYDYDAYATYRGQELGIGTKTHHAEISYNNTFGDWTVGASVTYDVSDLMHYQVLSDKAFPYLGTIMGLGDAYNAILNQDGVYRYHDAQENNLGTLIKADYNYKLGNSHSGILSFGSHYNRFELEDTRYLIGVQYNTTLTEPSELKENGKGVEHGADAYVQAKHKWKNWILNVGLRYDYKHHSDGDHINEFSPRAAIVYVSKKWNAKVNFSRSFVDAPYFYRKTNQLLGTYLVMGEKTTIADLMPETLYSWQASFGSNKLVKGLNFEINWFFNHAENLIYSNGLIHSNAASGKNTGVELTADYTLKRFNAHFTFTWQKMLEMSYNLEIEDFQPNVPYLSSNLVLSYRLLKHLKAHSHFCFYGKQDTLTVQLLPSQSITFGTVDPRFIVNLGAEYELLPFTIGFDVHNLFNTTYSQGALGAGNVRQQGLWLLGYVTVKI